MLKPAIILVAFAALAALSPAPIRDRAALDHNLAVQSDAMRTDEQSMQRVQAPVGDLNLDESNLNRQHLGNQDAAATLASADRGIHQSANSVLEQANREVQKGSATPKILLAVFFSALVPAGLIFGLRRYADKTVPEPTQAPKVRW